jgi:hypothetical protein
MRAGFSRSTSRKPGQRLDDDDRNDARGTPRPCQGRPVTRPTRPGQSLGAPSRRRHARRRYRFARGASLISRSRRGVASASLRHRSSSSLPYGRTGTTPARSSSRCALGDRRMARCARCRSWQSGDGFATRVGSRAHEHRHVLHKRPSCAPARRRRVVDLGGPPAARRCDDLKPC